MTKRRDLWDELAANSPLQNHDLPHIVDFDEYKGILAGRVQTWVQAVIEDLDEKDWVNMVIFPIPFMRMKLEAPFATENSWFSTNKPNAHKALFFEAGIKALIFEAECRSYILQDGSVSPEMIALFRQGRADNFPPDDWTFKYPDYTEIRSLAQKDTELFPDEAEPLRAEVAGTILNFTTWDAVLVVYMDNKYKGKKIQLDIDWYNYRPLQSNRKAEIIERPIDGGIVAAAIFRVPIVTDWLRHSQKVVKKKDCTVTFESHSPRFQWEEIVTLFPGNVIELDWRYRSQ